MTVSDERRAIERARVARTAAGEVQALLLEDAADTELKLVISGPQGDRAIALPRAAVELLTEVLEALGDGREPTVVPFARDLSTGEVANLLGVSRQYVVRLLDDGRLPFSRVGNRRRIALSDALKYLRADDRRRVDGLRAIAESSVS